jgi:predicted phage tail component-like protein
MYNFVDVNEASEDVVLPSEALQINGEYIENLISGYRTLNVVGREALSMDVESQSTGVRDGSKLKNKRYPERIIIVTYQIIAESNEAFREAYNQLGKILDVENAELIFNDEPDKFFVGTPCIIDEVDPGRNAVVGKFEILCTDPFKYSVVEYEAYPNEDENSIYVDYNGTYKAYPILEADFYNEAEVADDGETAVALTGAGDCGYVAFFNEDERIIQLGDPEEVDGIGGLAKSQTLMNQTFLSETAWGTTAKNLWAVNSGNIMATNVTQQGSVAMAKASTTTANTSGKTSGSIYKGGVATTVFKISYSTKNRKANAVDVTLTAKVTMTAGAHSSGATMSVVVYIGGTPYTIVVKKSGRALSSNQSCSASRTVTISGIKTSQTEITGITMKAILMNNGNTTYPVSGSCSNIKISEYSTTAYANYYLAPNAYGTADSGWHGPTITRSIGADAAGDVGAANFTLTYKQRMCIGSASSAKNQMGSFRMNLTDASGNNVAGIWVYKNKSGKTGKLVFYVNGKKVNETDIDLHYKNKFFGLAESSVATTTVTKSGGTITFAVGSYKRQFTVSALASVAVRKVTFSFEKYASTNAMYCNGLYWAKFVKNNCDTYKDIPNKFSANDVLEADCKNGEIYLNGVLSPELGALGNDWERFFLVPGFNEIGFSYSEWVASGYAPSMKIRYREVFL